MRIRTESRSWRVSGKRYGSRIFLREGRKNKLAISNMESWMFVCRVWGWSWSVAIMSQGLKRNISPSKNLSKWRIKHKSKAKAPFSPPSQQRMQPRHDMEFLRKNIKKNWYISIPSNWSSLQLATTGPAPVILKLVSSLLPHISEIRYIKEFFFNKNYLVYSISRQSNKCWPK